MIEINKIYAEKNLETMARMPDGFIDCIVTDPQYGYSFMNKDWDKAVPSVEIWRECLRVLKPGAFAFIMSAPRQDVLSHNIVNLTDAGFDTSFTSIYWVYASGFPKASNISKQVDKKFGKQRTELIGKSKYEGRRPNKWGGNENGNLTYGDYNAQPEMPIYAAASDEAKMLDGSYGGFQPKPAVEIIIVVMKPLETKTFTEQALKNGKGVTWLQDCMIPTSEDRTRLGGKDPGLWAGKKSILQDSNEAGRFPANLLVSDDALNDGNVYESGDFLPHHKLGMDEDGNVPANVYGKYKRQPHNSMGDSGSFSRYFSLDAWWTERLKNFPKSVLQTFPFLIEPKASKSEKNFGCENFEGGEVRFSSNSESGQMMPSKTSKPHKIKGNSHPTVKPVKLLSYLITLGSRENEIVYDPFGGSGTTGVAAEMLNRKWILSEMDKDSCTIAEKRLYPYKIVQKLF